MRSRHHTFGTRWLQAGGDIYKLSKILGHSSVAVTEAHYAYLLKEDLVAASQQVRIPVARVGDVAPSDGSNRRSLDRRDGSCLAIERDELDLKRLTVRAKTRSMVYTTGIYRKETMTTTAKLFKNGRSQAVRLPREFRFEGDRVRVRRAGRGVLVEPMFTDVSAWFAELDLLASEPFMPEGRQQPPTPQRDVFDDDVPA
jgi:antitoxin VapB